MPPIFPPRLRARHCLCYWEKEWHSDILATRVGWCAWVVQGKVELLFPCLWCWGLLMNLWHGSTYELHKSMRMLFLFTPFCIPRQVRHPPLCSMGIYSPLMDHF